MNPARFFTGWAELRCTGPEPEGFFTLLGESGIPFWDAPPPENYCVTVRLPQRYAAKALRLAASAGCEAAVTKSRGLPRAARKLRRRWLPAALLPALLLLLAWSQSYIWFIDVTGNETIPEGVIRNTLAECGVDIGTRWVGMSQDEVRNSVILRLPGIRWMTVTMQGSRAHVIVREALEKPELVPEDEYADVVADRAGLVTRVYALRGTAETAENRFLLPGDTIIGGYATGRFGVQGPVRAIGWAEARTWHTITAAAPAALAVKSSAGAKSVRFSLILGHTRINLYKDSSICPAECDKIIESLSLSIPGVFTLPITLEKTTITPYETRSLPAEELPEELSSQLREELVRRIGAEGQIVSEEYAVWEAEGFVYVTLEAECLERIGRTEPLTEAELAHICAKIPDTAEE